MHEEMERRLVLESLRAATLRRAIRDVAIPHWRAQIQIELLWNSKGFL